MIQGENLQLCFSIDFDQHLKVKKSKNILDIFVAQQIQDCDYVLTQKTKTFPTVTGREVTGHNHFENFQ